MTRNTNALKAIAMAFVILTATLGMSLAAAPVSAESSDDNSVVDALFSIGDENTTGISRETALAFVSGIVSKYSPLSDHPKKANATTYANRVEQTFDGNASVLMNWTNERVTADTDTDVVRLQFSSKSDGGFFPGQAGPFSDGDRQTRWMFVVASVNSTSGNYTNARMMNYSEFEKLDRSVDKTYRLSPYASRNANQELQTFITEYAEPGKNVSRAYLARLAAEYRGEISGSSLPGGS